MRKRLACRWAVPCAACGPWTRTSGASPCVRPAARTTRPRVLEAGRCIAPGSRARAHQAPSAPTPALGLHLDLHLSLLLACVAAPHAHGHLCARHIVVVVVVVVIAAAILAVLLLLAGRLAHCHRRGPTTLVVRCVRVGVHIQSAHPRDGATHDAPVLAERRLRLRHGRLHLLDLERVPHTQLALGASDAKQRWRVGAELEVENATQLQVALGDHLRRVAAHRPQLDQLVLRARREDAGRGRAPVDGGCRLWVRLHLPERTAASAALAHVETAHHAVLARHDEGVAAVRVPAHLLRVG
mmetsp:Transcript_70867/g.188566  ORF Transcript_70867/g.188566 Transcript_70867/m.188566 type:complete len:298 (-) Transcript_70867:992-1885(-)